MPTPTYDAIASTTLSSSASSVTFSSLDTIAAGYRDLVVVISSKATATGGSIRGTINSDSGSNYNRVFMYGTGSATSSGSTASFTAMAFSGYGNLSATNFDDTIIHFLDFSVTDKHKSALSRGNNSDSSFASTDAIAHRWASTSAITTLNFFVTAGASFASGSTFSLYGIVA